MASIFPVSVAIPIHATVEASASIFRSYLLRKYIDWSFFFIFVVFGALGICLAVPFIGMLPESIIQLVLGLFILLITWMPIGLILSHNSDNAKLGGLVTSFLTVFVGATGPLVAALLAKRLSEHARVIATHSICMSMQHAAKIIVFASIGWQMTSFAIEIAAMILATGLGTWLGRYIIVSGPKDLIKAIFKTTVTILGLQLVGEAIIEIY
jgi:uncharacterized membrane protein YfcA